jgi:hypothetical protein
MRTPFHRGTLALIAALALHACEADAPTSPTSEDRPGLSEGQPVRLLTAADTAAFLKHRHKRPQLSGAQAPITASFGVPGYCFSGANTGVNGGISMCPGDTLIVTSTFAECSGVNDTMRVDGPVNFILSTDACNDVGATHTEVATVAGNLTFTQIDPRFGSGSWRTSGTYPDLVVEMEEGFGDLDYDDNVLSVHLGRRPCPPTGNPVLDDPQNRAQFELSFQASNPNGPQVQRKEHMVAGYQFPDGHVEREDLNPPQAHNCGIPGYDPPLTKGEGQLIWLWHSHPWAPGELASQCGDRIFGVQEPYPASPSPQDWQALRDVNNRLFAEGKPPIDGYIWDQFQAMWMKHDPIDASSRKDFKPYDRSSCQH